MVQTGANKKPIRNQALGTEASHANDADTHASTKQFRLAHIPSSRIILLARSPGLAPEELTQCTIPMEDGRGTNALRLTIMMPVLVSMLLLPMMTRLLLLRVGMANNIRLAMPARMLMMTTMPMTMMLQRNTLMTMMMTMMLIVSDFRI